MVSKTYGQLLVDLGTQTDQDHVVSSVVLTEGGVTGERQDVGRAFFAWCNHAHYPVGLVLMHPGTVP